MKQTEKEFVKAGLVWYDRHAAVGPVPMDRERYKTMLRERWTVLSHMNEEQKAIEAEEFRASNIPQLKATEEFLNGLISAAKNKKVKSFVSKISKKNKAAGRKAKQIMKEQGGVQ